MCVRWNLKPAKWNADGTRITAYDARTEDGRTVEIKGESYTFDKSKNFMFEKTSNEEAGTLGGPWRAQKGNRVDRIIYYSPSDDTFGFGSPSN